MTNRDVWEKKFDAAPSGDVDSTTISDVEVQPVYGPPDGEFPGLYP